MHQVTQKKIIDKAKNTDIIMAGYADGEYLRQLYSNRPYLSFHLIMRFSFSPS